ncbi:hypothetical protein NQ317_001725 [Molorchus minor]|uniref:G-protein coupled receptors family 1 profile domain-containing protein n=1 Tax=Molorchus minor TaxID=1323400 RepID=A0ABQ9J8S9_9CUCU|nr:hypothetical protein NQ317_001725 [Molorchus minor]
MNLNLFQGAMANNIIGYFVTNYFLVNLSVADLLVTLVCMPNAAWRAYTTIYNFGEVTCKISAYLQCEYCKLQNVDTKTGEYVVIFMLQELLVVSIIRLCQKRIIISGYEVREITG